MSKQKATIIAVCSAIVVTLAVVATILSLRATGLNEAKQSSGSELKPTMVSKTGSFAVSKDGVIVPPNQANKDLPRVEMILDMHCPGCRIIETELNDSLIKNVKEGKIQLWITPASITDRHSSDKYATRAGSALVTVMEGDPEHALDFMRAIYQNFPNPEPQYTPVSDEDLATLAKNSGVKAEVADEITKEKYVWFLGANTNVQNSRTEVFANGAQTPTVILGGSEDSNGALKNHTIVNFDGRVPIVGQFAKAVKDAFGSDWLV